ncbi:MAG: peptidase and chymotrypsin/Hap [Planctomycetaceae bacterium]|nr:peptidase and chymotrypsin/Hap [Planctomycetaceae bacterium]
MLKTLWSRTFWCGISLCLLLASPVRAADKWPLLADPAAANPVWDVAVGSTFDIENGIPNSPADILRPATGAPILLLGNGSGSSSREVWRLTDFTKLGTLAGRIDTSTGSFAISPDGKFFTVTKKKSFTATGAEIWSIEENKKLKILDVGPATEAVLWSGFVSETMLLTLHESSPNQTWIRLTDISVEASAKAAVAFPGPRNIDKRNITLSPGGRFLAVGTQDGAIAVTDLKVKQAAFRLPVPPGLGQCAAIRFSPDGTELGVLFQVIAKGAAPAQSAQVLAWNLADGQLSIQLKDVVWTAGLAPATANSDVQLAFEWLPDGSALLIGNSTLIDRNSGQIVWRLRLPSHANSKAPRIFLGTEYLLIPKQQALTQGFAAFKLPWKEIDAGLKSLQSKAEAWLRPGEKLSLKVEVGDTRFQKADQVRGVLAAKLEQQLKEDHFVIADGQPVTLKIAYSEAAGGLLQKRDDMPFPFSRPPRFPGFRTPPFPTRPMLNENDRMGTGTAFVIHADGYLLTCAHVVGAAPSVQVKLGDKTYHARVISKNVALDFALLKVEVKNLTVLPLADSSKIELGEEVRAVGYPISTVLGESLKATRGTIAGLVKKDNTTMFQIDASINPGNSGGPLINEKGEVIGINSAKLIGESVDNVGLSIPINEVKAMLKDQKVEFQPKGSIEKLAGPELVKRVTPSVAFVISTGGVDHGDVGGLNKVIVTRITCDLSLLVKDQPQPVWQEKIVIEPNQLRIQGQLTEQKARDLAFDSLLERLTHISLPYFISKDPTPVVLPLVSDLTSTEQNPMPVLGPRRTRRGM